VQPKAEPRLRLRLTSAAEAYIRKGHPWVFASSIREENRPGKMGELAVIYDKRDKFLAIGLYDPESPLRVRILHAGDPIQLDDRWWSERLRETWKRREGLFNQGTTGYRCIHGEGDGWPGLVLDRYATTYVLKLYTSAWLSRLPKLIELLRNQFGPERLVLRLSRNMQASAAASGYRDGQLLFGSEIPAAVIFCETGLQFEADVVRGQKTGFFLDQRENRRQVERLAQGRTVLNAFSFSGGFSLYAARGGARSVTNLDISAHALRSAERNFELNRDVPQISRCPREAVQADAFEWLAGPTKQTFGLVILDPPALAKRQSERAAALVAYRRLIESGIKRVDRGGILVAASCSAPVTEQEFFETLAEAAQQSGRRFKELLRTGQPADHPATFEEGKYLKCGYYEF